MAPRSAPSVLHGAFARRVGCHPKRGPSCPKAAGVIPGPWAPHSGSECGTSPTSSRPTCDVMTNGLPVCRFSGHQRMDSAFTRASPIRCEPEGVRRRVCAGCALGLCREFPGIAVPVAALRSPEGAGSSASCHFVDEQRSSKRASEAQGLPSRQRGTSTAMPCNPMLRSAPVRGKVLRVGLVSSRPIPRHGRCCNEAASQARQDRP
jgi:hypothetical protein